MSYNSKSKIIDKDPVIELAPRKIYEEVNSNFSLLTDAYGLQLQTSTLSKLTTLIRAIDLVDNYLDQLQTKEERTQLSKNLLDFLTRNEEAVIRIPGQIEAILQELRADIDSFNVTQHFTTSLKALLRHTEAKRHAQNRNVFFDHVRKEGIATGELPLLFLSKEISDSFKEMFLIMCQSMGMADLLLDAKEDYKSGLSPIRPSIRLYFSILRYLIPAGWKIFWTFPKKWNLIKYLSSMIYHLLMT